MPAKIIKMARSFLNNLRLDLLDWNEKEKFPDDDAIFEYARRLCPKCAPYSECETEEIGRHSILNELVLRCKCCGIVFLGTLRGEVLGNLELEHIQPIN